MARELHAVLVQVRDGVEVIIEENHRPIAVLKASDPGQSDSRRPGRKLSECIALAMAYEAKLGTAPIPDDDFAKDVEAGIDAHRDGFEPPAGE